MILVILWGAFVRATGSGAGCGDHWPVCNGQVIPRDPSIETMIELALRLTSGLALIAAMVLPIWARRLYPAGHPVRLYARRSLLVMVTEALVGAGPVLFQLVAENASVARAIAVGAHLVNTFLLLAAMARTARHAAPPIAPPEATLPWRARLLGRFGSAGLILVGVSGAIAALGDTLFPTGSLAEALRVDLSPTSHVLI